MTRPADVTLSNEIQSVKGARRARWEEQQLAKQCRHSASAPPLPATAPRASRNDTPHVSRQRKAPIRSRLRANPALEAAAGIVVQRGRLQIRLRKVRDNSDSSRLLATDFERQNSLQKILSLFSTSASSFRSLQAAKSSPVHILLNLVKVLFTDNRSLPTLRPATPRQRVAVCRSAKPNQALPCQASARQRSGAMKISSRPATHFCLPLP